MSLRPESAGVHARQVSSPMASTCRMSARVTASGGDLVGAPAPREAQPGASPSASVAGWAVGGAPPASFGGVEDDLAESNGRRGHLHAFILPDEFEPLFQRKLERRDQADRLVRRRRSHVG